MNAKQSVLQKIKDGTFALLTDEEIAKRLKLGRKESLGLRDILRALVREGELLSDSRYRYGTAQQFGAKKGTFSGNERGFGFVIPEDGTPDLFIPRRAVKNALHGDTVLCIPVRGRSDDEGEILAVLSRGYTELVGTFRREGKIGYLHPDERKYNRDVLILPGKTNNCPPESKAVARIVSYRPDNTPVGEIKEVLGEKGDFFAEELSLIRAHHLYENFPEDVLEEAKKQEDRFFDEKDLRSRLDLRGELIITIDGEDTRDIDDAISVSEKDGIFSLGVHIADVTHYVTRNSVLDQEAFKRGTSVYFPDRVLPMLPPALSNGICSLNEGVERLTLSCLMQVDRSGKVVKGRIAPSVIRSRHRMTYTEVTKLYERDEETVKKYPDLVEMVDTAVRLTKILKDARSAKGGVAMDLKEAKILYVDGKIVIPEYERTISHELIEQFMVLANETVATLMTEKKMPFVYRVHESPSEEKAKDFVKFLSEAGVNAKFNPAKVTPFDYQELLRSLEGNALYPLVNRVMLRSMMKAKYSAENVGHFGLASECYCHFTSPIRRYPDLCIHRIIKESLSRPEETKEKYKNFVVEAAYRSSECERNATDAERDVDALYTVAYMQDKIGETFEATVSGVTSFGLFAELDNTIEGFLPVETLPDDYYEFIEERFQLRGTRQSFRLGERLLVQVAGVDWGMRRTQFRLLTKLDKA